MFIKKNLVFIIIIFLALLVSLTVLVKKVLLEQNANNIEICIDFNKFENICLNEGKNIYESLQLLLKTGINSILVREDTINSLVLAQKIYVLTGAELLKNLYSLVIVNPLISEVITYKEIKPNYTYIIVLDQKLHDRIYSELKVRFKDNELKSYIKTENIKIDNKTSNYISLITINNVQEDILNIGLGVDIKTIELLNKLGFSIVFGIPISNLNTLTQIDRIFENIQIINNLSTILIENNTNSQLNIDEENIEYLGKKIFKISNLKIKFAVILDQNVNLLVKYIRNMSIKAYCINNNELNKFNNNLEAIFNSCINLIKLNGVKLLIFHSTDNKFLNFKSNVLTQNIEFLSKLVNKIKYSGFNIKSAFAVENDLAFPVVLIIISWGIITLYILFFEKILRMPRKISYLFLVILMTFTFIFIMNFYQTELIIYFRNFLTLLCSIIILLGIVLYRPNDTLEENVDFKIVFYKSIINLFYTILYLLILSILIIGILSSAGFINGIDKYELMYLNSILTILFTFLLSVRIEHLTKKVKRLINEQIKVYHLLIILIVLMFLTPYLIMIVNVIRQSLDPATISYNISYFNIFEKVLKILPTYVEFLIGYPVLLLYFFINYYKIRVFNPILLTIGILGPLSCINTICTVTYPISLFLMRTIVNVILSIFIGIPVCYFAYKIILIYNNKKLNENSLSVENYDRV